MVVRREARGVHHLLYENGHHGTRCRSVWTFRQDATVIRDIGPVLGLFVVSKIEMPPLPDPVVSLHYGTYRAAGQPTACDLPGDECTPCVLTPW